MCLRLKPVGVHPEAGQVNLRLATRHEKDGRSMARSWPPGYGAVHRPDLVVFVLASRLRVGVIGVLMGMR
jgi:hypothetical protein